MIFSVSKSWYLTGLFEEFNCTEPSSSVRLPWFRQPDRVTSKIVRFSAPRLMSSEVYLFDVCGGNQVIFWPNRLVADEAVNQADSMMKTKKKTFFFKVIIFDSNETFSDQLKDCLHLQSFFCKTESDSDINRHTVLLRQPWMM